MQYYNNYHPAGSYAAAQDQQYQAYMYKKALKKNSNGIGALLLVFFGLEIILSVFIMIISAFAGVTNSFFSDSVFELITNGLVSSVIFFVVGLVYCLIRRLSFSELFPFEKTGGAMLSKLCVIGISFSLMSNYVVDLVNNTFGLFGLENSGGSFDTGSNPDALIYMLTVAILPAFVEEFAFRGVIMGALRPYSEGLAILVSSAAFALMHGNFVQLPFTFCCGLVFAYIDIKSNSLLPSIIVHFLNNGLSVLGDLLTSYDIMDDFAVNMCYGVIFVITGILSFIFIRSIIKERGKEFFKLSNGNEILPFKTKVKTVASSPTMISFAVIMLLYSADVSLLGIFFGA